MADDIRSRAGLHPGEEAARRVRDGRLRRSAASEALTQEQMRERTMREMAERRAAQAQAQPQRPAAPPPSAGPRPAPVSAAASRGLGGGGQAALLGMAAMGAEMALRRLVEASRGSAAGEGDAYGLNDVAPPQRAFAGEEMPFDIGPAPSMTTTSAARAAPARSQPRRPQPRPAPRQELTADQLNDISLARSRGEANPVSGAEAALANMRMAQREAENRQGGSGNLGAASARERGEQVGPPGDYNMSKGGMAKKAPYKMAKGGMATGSYVGKKKMAAGGDVSIAVPATNGRRVAPGGGSGNTSVIRSPVANPGLPQPRPRVTQPGPGAVPIQQVPARKPHPATINTRPRAVPPAPATGGGMRPFGVSGGAAGGKPPMGTLPKGTMPPVGKLVGPFPPSGEGPTATMAKGGMPTKAKGIPKLDGGDFMDEMMSKMRPKTPTGPNPKKGIRPSKMAAGGMAKSGYAKPSAKPMMSKGGMAKGKKR